jgi:hypothetical protein
MPNLKTLEPALDWDLVDDEPMDVASQMAIENGFEKFFDFLFFSLDLEFDPAINQIFHPPNHVEARRDRFDRISEANSLNAPFVENSPRDHEPPSPGFGLKTRK